MMKKCLMFALLATGPLVTVGCGDRHEFANTASGSSTAVGVHSVATGQESIAHPATQIVENVSAFCGSPGASEEAATPAFDVERANVVPDPTGGLSLVIADAQGKAMNLGCMSAQTAESSVKLGLSFGAVLKVKDQIVLALAVPDGKRLRSMEWLHSISATTLTAGFNVTLFAVDRSRFTDTATPTELQIQQYANAADDGAISTGGFGPDILG